jgi:nicotinamide riboside kinase
MADHFHAPLSPEYVRAFAAERGGKLSFNDHGAIAKGQMAAEDAAVARARDLVILDTDLVSTVVYCDHYFGQTPAWIEEKAKERLADVYLLCAADIPWQPDGVRDRGDRRDEMDELFRARLRQYNALVVDIRGDRDARFQLAVNAIQRLTSVAPGQT